MKTIIIDPVNRTVSETIVHDKLENWQAIVGGLIECVVTLPKSHTIWANEEGLLLPPPFHWWGLHNQPIAMTGKAFIVRQLSGKFLEPKITLAEVEAMVEFIDTDEARIRHAARQAQRRAEFEEYKAKRPDWHHLFIESKFPA